MEPTGRFCRRGGIVAMRKRLALAVGLVVMLILSGCGGSTDTGGESATGGDADDGEAASRDQTETDGDERQEETGERYALQMGMAHNATWTAEWWGWMAAQEVGYLDELGLDVEFVAAGGSGAAIEQLAAGNLDVANPSMPSVGEALLAGIDLVNYYTYSNGAIFGIFASGDSGIASVADLDGTTIGISEPGGGEVAFLESALRAEGIDPIGDVTLIPIGEGGPETFQAIESGQVDAYSSAYNDIFAMEVQGLTLTDITPEGFGTYPARGIITRPDVIEEQEEALKRLARATAMGTHFCLSNLDACEQIMRSEIPEIWEENAEGQSQGSLRYELAQQQVPPQDPDTYGGHNVDGTIDFIDAIASTMEGAPDVDVEAFLHDDFLEDANDFDRARVEEDAADYGG